MHIFRAKPIQYALRSVFLTGLLSGCAHAQSSWERGCTSPPEGVQEFVRRNSVVLQSAVSRPATGSVVIFLRSGRESREPIFYGQALLRRLDAADSTDVLSGTTSESGEVKFVAIRAGTYRLLVRRIAHVAQQHLVEVRAGAIDTLNIRMKWMPCV